MPPQWRKRSQKPDKNTNVRLRLHLSLGLRRLSGRKRGTCNSTPIFIVAFLEEGQIYNSVDRIAGKLSRAMTVEKQVIDSEPIMPF